LLDAIIEGITDILRSHDLYRKHCPFSIRLCWSWLTACRCWWYQCWAIPRYRASWLAGSSNMFWTFKCAFISRIILYWGDL